MLQFFDVAGKFFVEIFKHELINTFVNEISTVKNIANREPLQLFFNLFDDKFLLEFPFFRNEQK